MSVLSWNVHEFNELARMKETTKSLVKNKVGVFALLETKAKKFNYSRITNQMGDKWKWLENYDSDDSGVLGPKLIQNHKAQGDK